MGFMIVCMAVLCTRFVVSVLKSELCGQHAFCTVSADEVAAARAAASSSALLR